MKASEAHCHVMAERLRAFLCQLPGLHPYNLGEDPQKILVEYVAPIGCWTDELEQMRRLFVDMPKIEFEMVYATFRATQLRS